MSASVIMSPSCVFGEHDKPIFCLAVESVPWNSTSINAWSPVYCHCSALLPIVVLVLYVYCCLPSEADLLQKHCQILKMIHCNMAVLLIMTLNAAYWANIMSYIWIISLIVLTCLIESFVVTVTKNIPGIYLLFLPLYISISPIISIVLGYAIILELISNVILGLIPSLLLFGVSWVFYFFLSLYNCYLLAKHVLHSS